MKAIYGFLALLIIPAASFGWWVGSGTIQKISYSNGTVSSTVKGYYVWLKDAGVDKYGWVGSDEKDVLSILLTAKSTGATVLIRTEDGAGNGLWVNYNGIAHTHIIQVELN